MLQIIIDSSSHTNCLFAIHKSFQRIKLIEILFQIRTRDDHIMVRHDRRRVPAESFAACHGCRPPKIHLVANE